MDGSRSPFNLTHVENDITMLCRKEPLALVAFAMMLWSKQWDFETARSTRLFFGISVIIFPVVVVKIHSCSSSSNSKTKQYFSDVTSVHHHSMIYFCIFLEEVIDGIASLSRMMPFTVDSLGFSTNLPLCKTCRNPSFAFR